MYTYHPPKPLLISLKDAVGYELRIKTAEYLKENQNKTGAERGSIAEQGFGALAEIVIRHKLGMPIINSEDHSLAYDILLPSGVKVDVKCRGGAFPFQEKYTSDDEIPREAKHNFFARQLYDEKLDTDIYLMTHLETPKDRTLPGTKRQRKWNLYICGWVSKKRALREGVFLPRGSLTEQGRTWFTYRGQEIEFYHHNLNGLNQLEDILNIDQEDIRKDEESKGDINLTKVDAIRITYDLVGRGILEKKHLEFIKNELKINKEIKPILHANQYFHLLKWFEENNQISSKEIEKAKESLFEEPYSGI